MKIIDIFRSFLLEESRELARKQGKDALLNFSNLIDICAISIMKIEKINNIKLDTPERYLQKVFSTKIEYFQEIESLYYSLGEKNYDTHFSFSKKQATMINSINLFIQFLQEFKEDTQYVYFWKKERQSDGDMLLENIQVKIEEEKELKKILKSMSNINMNMTLVVDGQTIYPIIFDIMKDTISIEYTLGIDKELIQSIITEWKLAEKAQKERKFFTNLSFSRIEVFQQIKYHRIRKYILSEYARTLQVDKKKLRTFIQHILYFDVTNHKGTPGLEFDTIKEIKKRPFILEKTKMIIGNI